MLMLVCWGVTYTVPLIHTTYPDHHIPYQRLDKKSSTTSYCPCCWHWFCSHSISSDADIAYKCHIAPYGVRQSDSLYVLLPDPQYELAQDNENLQSYRIAGK